MQSMKETASNMAASAKAGMEKTKAAVQEKVERMSAHDPVQKEMATERKEERIGQANLHKQEVHEHNAAARQANAAGGRAEYTTAGPGATYESIYGTETHTHSATGYPTGTHHMSATPGHGTGQPYGGMVEEGIARTCPSGLPGETTGHNVFVEGNTRTGSGLNEPGYGLGARGERPGYGEGSRADEPGYGSGGTYS